MEKIKRSVVAKSWGWARVVCGDSWSFMEDELMEYRGFLAVKILGMKP